MTSWQGLITPIPIPSTFNVKKQGKIVETGDLTYVELFCGAGGMSIGMRRAGLKCVLAVDINELAIANYENYFKDGVGTVASVRDLDKDRILDLARRATGIDLDSMPLMVAGPPCQGFSLNGHRNVMDDRNSLVDDYLRIIDEMQPTYFLMENVLGILSMLRPPNKKHPEQDELVVDWISKKIRKMGYQYKMAKIHSHLYGDPQRRTRIIFAAWKDGHAPIVFPPRPSRGNMPYIDLFGNRIPGPMTVREAFDGIDRTWHCPTCDATTEHGIIELRSHGTVVKCLACAEQRELPDGIARNNILVYESGDDFIERLKSVKPGAGLYDNYSSAYRRLFLDKPAFTVKENHGAMFIHPVEDRMISIREMISLQSFPNDYVFVGPSKDVIKLIGNAVPCHMAEALGHVVFDAWNRDVVSHSS